LCERKRAKRHCPGVGGEICPGCCGAERENTIDCPLDCVYLREARIHERVAAVEGELPNPDVRVTEEFAREHDTLIVWLLFSLRLAMENAQAVDNDAREALGALVQTYRTRESGLIYETRPQNLYAAQVQESLTGAIADFRKRQAGRSGMDTLRDSEILKSLVFLQRLELSRNTGRRRGRAFLDFLRTSLSADSAETSLASAGEAPLIEL
jgi:hypothetical protein